MARVWAKSVQLADGATGKRLSELKYDGRDCIRLVAFSDDGRYLITAHNKNFPDLNDENAVGSGENGLHIWDLASGKELRHMTAGRDCFYLALALTPDGNTAITSTAGGRISAGDGKGRLAGTHTDYSEGGPIYVWDLPSGREILTLDGHIAAAYALAVSRDSRLLASAGADATAHVWELVSGQLLFALATTKPFYYLGVALSPDGRLLAASRAEKDAPAAICLYELRTGKEVHRFRGHEANAQYLAFSPDGIRLASGLKDGTVLLWDLAPVLRAVRQARRAWHADDWPRFWDDLGSLDGPRVQQATWTLADGGDAVVDLLRKQLHPAKADAKRMRELIAGVDSEDFDTRERSMRALAGMGPLAEPALRQALKANLSLEARRRLEPLLQYRRMYGNPATLRRLRAIGVLERIGTAKAREVLQTLASGDSTARLTREAVNAIARMDALARKSGVDRRD